MNVKHEIFLDEVLQQPQALSQMLDYYLSSQGADLLTQAGALCAQAKRGPAFVGMGSSHCAPLIASHILSTQSASACVCEAGELLYYYLGGLSNEHVLVAVSQSGQTIEVRKIVEARKDNMKVIGITNNPDSWLGSNCDILLPITAGKETMSTSKTYVNTVALLSMLAWQTVSKLDDNKKAELLAVPDLLAGELCDWEERMMPAADFLGELSFLHLVARGPSHATVLQGQVIIKEGAHILTEAHSGASFRHGPFEIIDRNHRALVSAALGLTTEVTFSLVRDMAGAGSKVLLVTNAPSPPEDDNIFVYQLPQVAEYIYPMLDIIPVELLLILIARQMGVEPGAITKGSKVTVRE